MDYFNQMRHQVVPMEPSDFVDEPGFGEDLHPHVYGLVKLALKELAGKLVELGGFTLYDQSMIGLVNDEATHARRSRNAEAH